MAAYVISDAGGNWNSAASYVANSGTPIAGDSVTATATSGNLTINVASACASIILTNYTRTLTYTNTLTTTSTVTYPSGMTVAGTADHITVTGSTITISCASGLTGGLRLGGTSQTYTLGSDWTIAGTLLFNGTTAITFSGAHNIACGVLSDTMTVSAITMSGNITVTGDAALSSGTSTTITGGFTLQAATCTISGGQTVNITSASVTITGLTTSSTVNVCTGGTWNTGGLSVTGATTGTTVFNLTGGTVTLTAALSCSMTFAGNVTWASQTNLYAASGTPTLTHASGTITVGTSVLSIASSCTIVPSTTTLLHDLIITAAATLTTNTNILIGDGTLTGPNAAVTFAGSAGWTFATVTNTAIASSAKTYTFTAGNTYTVTTNMDFTGATAALTLTLVSSHASNKVALVVGPGAVQDVGYVVATRIDSSAGQTVFSYKGTLTTCFNWITAYPVNAALVDPSYQLGM